MEPATGDGFDCPESCLADDSGSGADCGAANRFAFELGIVVGQRNDGTGFPILAGFLNPDDGGSFGPSRLWCLQERGLIDHGGTLVGSLAG